MSHAREPDPPLLRNALIPAWLSLAFALYYGAHLHVIWIAIAVAPLVVLYVVAPGWAVRSIAAFDRDALRLRATGAGAALPSRYRRAIGMRLFGAPAAIAERRGIAMQAAGDTQGALEGYRRAVETSGDAVPLSVVVGLAHAARAAGQNAEAIGAFRRVLAMDATLPRVRLGLARSLVSRAQIGDAEEALALLDAIPSGEEREEVSALREQAKKLKR